MSKQLSIILTEAGPDNLSIEFSPNIEEVGSELIEHALYLILEAITNASASAVAHNDKGNVVNLKSGHDEEDE